MSRNLLVKDIRSRNLSAVDTRSKNLMSLDLKSKMTEIGQNVVQLYPSTINKGEPMGLLLSLTYPNTLTFNTAFHP